MEPPMTRALLALLLVTACSPSFQMTSGDEYLADRPALPFSDPSIRAAADVTGDLRFPARIGLARLVDGRLAPLPPAEAAALSGLTAQAGQMGQFAPLSTVVSGLVSVAAGAGPVDHARTVAARQHLDYLLILSHDLNANMTEAVFVDVRSGYAYAVAQTGLPGAPLGRNASQDARLRRTAALTDAMLPELGEMLEGLAARGDWTE
jgi:hypothetical protein